jgi:hypothetical protein
MSDIIIFMIFILGLIIMYCLGSVGIIWLICELMNWHFSLPMAIGVWLIATLIIGFVRKAVKRK